VSRKSQTVATFSVTIKVPPNMTLDELKQIIQNGTAGYSGGYQFNTDEIKVKLTKKETSYE